MLLLSTRGSYCTTLWTTHFMYVYNLLLFISASLLFLVVTCFCLCSSLGWYTPFSILCRSRSKEFEQFEGCSWKSLKVRSLTFFPFFIHEFFYQSLSCFFHVCFCFFGCLLIMHLFDCWFLYVCLNDSCFFFVFKCVHYIVNLYANHSSLLFVVCKIC